MKNEVWSKRQREIIKYLLKRWEKCSFEEILDDNATIFHIALFCAKAKNKEINYL